MLRSKTWRHVGFGETCWFSLYVYTSPEGSLMEEIVSKYRIVFAELKDMDTDYVLWMQWLHLELVYRPAASYEICLVVRRVRKIAKVGVSFVNLSVYLSVLPFVHYHWTDFHENLDLSVFENSQRKFKFY